MKVVLFCGGMGMRLREYSESIPKPLVPIGYRPILWHVMKYYAHYGHTDFILCLGWRGDLIKDYFLNYDECLSNDFVLTRGGRAIDLLHSDIHDWRITFVDTGAQSSIGERLWAVREHLAGEECFLANYSDGLTDLPLPRLIDLFERRQAVATFLSVQPKQSFHTVAMDADGAVTRIEPIASAGVWMNGGYFVLRQEVFDHMRPGEELVCEPFQRLIAAGKLWSLPYEGFWGCMDTYKEKQALDDMYARGHTPWEAWKKAPAESKRRISVTRGPDDRDRAVRERQHREEVG